MRYAIASNSDSNGMTLGPEVLAVLKGGGEKGWGGPDKRGVDVEEVDPEAEAEAGGAEDVDGSDETTVVRRLD